MQYRKTLGITCLGTLAVLATTLTITLPANATDSARSTSTFKRTSSPSTMSRTSTKRPTYKKPVYKTPTRRTSPSTSTGGSDAELTENTQELSDAELRSYIRSLRNRIRRLERLTGYPRYRRSGDTRTRSLNNRVATLERDLKPILARERRASKSRRAGAKRRRQTQKAVRDTMNNAKDAAQTTAGNVGRGASNAAKAGGRAAKKAANGVSQGISNGAKQAQDTFNNMMPGSN